MGAKPKSAAGFTDAAPRMAQGPKPNMNPGNMGGIGPQPAARGSFIGAKMKPPGSFLS